MSLFYSHTDSTSGRSDFCRGVQHLRRFHYYERSFGTGTHTRPGRLVTIIGVAENNMTKRENDLGELRCATPRERPLVKRKPL